MIGEVGDVEELYRRVRQSIGDQQMCYGVDGHRTVFLHAAFNDRSKRPSLDRANLKIARNPHYTRQGSEDGIVALQADAIRRLGPIPQLNAKNRPKGQAYEVDVTPDPRFGNCAHALVAMAPPPGSGAFKRLKEGLARLANEAQWRVEPGSPMPKARPGIVRDAFNCLLHRLRAPIGRRERA